MSDRTQLAATAPVEAPLAEGAGEGAPTAPHATLRGKLRRGQRRTGPEKFWNARRWRIAFIVMLVVSFFAHVGVSPWSLIPRGIEIRDVEGETAIPVDLLQEEEEPPPAVDQKTTSDPVTPVDPNGVAMGDAAIVRTGTDGGVEGGTAIVDAASDASDDGAPSDGGAASPEASPRDPVAMIGGAGAVQAGDPLVVLLVNAAEIRKNPVGAQMGPLLSAIPQWDDFMAGTNVDPIQQTDWVLISGPGLADTTNDVILVHYSASDAIVDRAIDVIAKKYDRGGPYDAGVPGVKAALGHADRAPRVFLRPQTGLLAVVPVHYANTAARILVKAKVSPRVRPGEAVRLKVAKPYQPFPDIPKTVSELRLWVVPRSDDGADVWAEGDCATEADAQDAAKHIRDVVVSRNSFFVRQFTHHLLDSVTVTAEGKQVKLHMQPTRDQLEVLLGFVSGQIRSLKNAPPPPPPPAPSPPSGTPAPQPPPPRASSATPSTPAPSTSR